MRSDPCADPASPETSAREGASGIPVVLGDGATWLLADGGLLNALDPIRDKIDDSARIGGQVEMADIGQAAWIMLAANYRLSGPEIGGLILGASQGGLAAAVMEALFGPEHPRRTYTTWAASALIANGIDPDAVPEGLRPHVLAQLVGTGRAIPIERFVESAVAAPKLAAFRARAEQAAAEAAAKGEGAA